MTTASTRPMLVLVAIMISTVMLASAVIMWVFPKIRVRYFGVLIIRIRLLRVLY